MGRSPCCEKVGLKRGPWTPEEDQKLISYINENGHGSWRALPKKAGLLRCGKSCRLRWTNYLRPDIKRGEFSLSEEQSIIQLHALLGNRWSAIASHLPQRTDNEIKNYWNTHLKKKLLKMGLDPVTHKPKVDNTLMSSNADPPKSLNASVDDKDINLIKDKNNNGANTAARTSFAINASSNSSNGGSATNHMAQWESARLEAEARLAHEAQLRAKGLWSARPAVPKPLNPAPLSALSPWSLSKPFKSTANSGGTCVVDTCKALNAVELMHVLHNWEKSLQGQAGVMWPESWRLPSMHFPFPEGQAESSSCSSPCSDANTNNNTSPSATAGPHGMDHSSPTSTLCSLDSHNMKQKGMQSPFVAGFHSSVHMRKLSWSDAFVPPLVKPEMPLGFCMQGVIGKVEEDSSTFSSLMQDAVINVDAVASAFVCSQEDGGGVLKTTSGQDVMDEGPCGIKDEEVTCEKLSFMVGDEHTSQEHEGASCGVKFMGAADKDGIVGNVSTCTANSSGGNELKVEQTSAENVSSLLLPSGMEPEEGSIKDGMKDCQEDNSGNNECHSYAPGSNEGRSTCVGAELMSAEMFKDLPKLKSEASTTHLTSFSTLLSDDISDYWSSIMLKEPSLQQGDMAF